MKRICLYITILAAIVSCAKEDNPGPIQKRQGDSAAVEFCCQVDRLVPSVAKSAFIPSSFDDALITGITVAAYDHSTGELHFKKHFTAGFDAMEIRLRTGTSYDLYALANMGDLSDELPDTRSELLSDYAYTVPSYADVSIKGLPMAGRIENYTAGASAENTFNLRRLFAKIVLNVDTTFDGGTSGGIRITDLRVGNGNGVLSVFGSSRMTVASQAIPVEDYNSYDSVNASQIIFYVPENRQGTVGSATSSHEKNPDCDAEIAALRDLLTYVDITVSANSEYYTGTVRYRSYVGANATTDFNVNGNNIYICNMTLTEDGLMYDDWKIDNSLTDGRYLRFIQNPSLVEAGDVVSWNSILETNLLWGDISKRYEGTAVYEATPNADGFTVADDADEGSVMSAVFAPLHNWHPNLEDRIVFRVVGRYIKFDKDIYSVNPRKTVKTRITYGDTFSGETIGLGGFAADDGVKWTVTAPSGLPHTASGPNCLDYSYDSATDSVSWIPTMFARPGDYSIMCGTVDGRHSDTAILHINDTRWINTQDAYAGRMRETSIARADINSSTDWKIGYAFGDLSISDDTLLSSNSPNAGYFAGNRIVDRWSDYIGFSLAGNAADFLSPSGDAACFSNTYSVSQDIPIGDYMCYVYWKDTWSEELGGYTVRDSAVLHISGNTVNSISIPTALSTNKSETASVRATVRPVNASFKKVSWVVTSGSGNIMVIPDGDQTASVTGLEVGTATIKAVAMDGSGVESNICTVNVTNKPVLLTLYPSVDTIFTGYTVSYTALATLYDGTVLDVTSDCTWRTDAYHVASVNESGVATGKTETGTCTITAQYQYGSGYLDYLVGSASLTVEAMPAIAEIEFLGGDQYYIYSSTGNNSFNINSLPIKIIFNDGTYIISTLGTVGAALTSDNNSVAKASSASGNSSIIAVAKGSATIVISLGGQQTDFTVRVSEMIITPSSVAIMSGDLSPEIVCTIIPYDRTEAIECEVAWSSEDTGIATVTTGFGSRTRARKETNSYATTMVNATYDGEFGTRTVGIPCTVYGGSSGVTHSLEIIPNGWALSVGETYQFMAKYHTWRNGQYDGGVIVTPSWMINSGDSYASIDANGIVTGLAAGTAQIRAYYNTYTAYATVVVTGSDTPSVITHYLEIIQETAVMETGSSQSMVAMYHTVVNGVDDGGAAVTPVWSVISGSAVAGISAEGTVSALSAGTAIVEASYTKDGETYTATATVNVVQHLVNVYRLKISPAESTISEGATQTYVVYKYTDIYSDGILSYEDPSGVIIPNTEVNWSIVSGSAYATVDASGIATGVASGDAIVRATFKEDTSIISSALLHIDDVFNVEPGDGGSGSGGGNY